VASGPVDKVSQRLCLPEDSYADWSKLVLFMYSLGNPVKFNDPSGHFARVFDDGGGAGEPLSKLWKEHPESGHSFGEYLKFRGQFERYRLDPYQYQADRDSAFYYNDLAAQDRITNADAYNAFFLHAPSVQYALMDGEARQRMALAGVVAETPALAAGVTAGGGLFFEFHSNPYLARLPARSGPKDKTFGILVAGNQEFMLASGYGGAARNVPRGTPGFNLTTRAHVEGHAAATMRQMGLEEATLYINNNPCAGVRGCNALLPSMLPPGSSLRIVSTSGFDQVYKGLPD
jgi:hypothetical protein